jgi:hypothetical protein
MTPRIPENVPSWLVDWGLVNMSNTMPPRDPNDDDDAEDEEDEKAQEDKEDEQDQEDEEDEEDEDLEPPVAIATETEYDRNCCGRRLGGGNRSAAAGGRDHRHLAADEIGRKRRQSIGPVFGESVFDRHVAALDITCFAEAAAECIRKVWPIISSQAAQVADHRHRLLLPPRLERPRGNRAAAEKRDEVATPHAEPSRRCAAPELSTAGHPVGHGGRGQPCVIFATLQNCF